MTLPQDDLQTRLRQLPRIDEILRSAPFALFDTTAEGSCIGHDQRTNAIRTEVETRRSALMNGLAPEDLSQFLSVEAIAASAVERLYEQLRPFLRNVVNATGVVLHTGLGRAVLPEAAIEAIANEMRGYCNLAADFETGERASRDRRLQEILVQLTGCEAATVVNNNAAATLLVLSALGAGREVVVSRGQLIEIGGSFRLPDVMAQSGCKLVEVGSTNRTHPRDYEQAINENTAILFRAHPSNYSIEGFTSEVPISALAGIAHRHDLIAVDDMGAGILAPTEWFCSKHEMTVRESLEAGADIVLFSGDKLVGGPQAGIVLGHKNLIQQIRRHPLARAFRIDKITACALEATLKQFLNTNNLSAVNPTWNMLMRSPESLRNHAQKLSRKIQTLHLSAQISILPEASRTGSGALPIEDLPTWLVRILPDDMSADTLARALRKTSPPVFTRIQNDSVLIDPRTLLKGDDTRILSALKQAFSNKDKIR